MRRAGLPLTALRLQCDAGSIHDPAGKGGLSALANDMLDEGAGALDALELSEQLETLGATLDGAPDRDGAALTLSVLSRNLPAALELYASTVTAPRLAEPDLAACQRLLGPR